MTRCGRSKPVLLVVLLLASPPAEGVISVPKDDLRAMSVEQLVKLRARIDQALAEPGKLARAEPDRRWKETTTSLMLRNESGIRH